MSELYEFLVNQSPDAIIFANKSGTIELWNPAAEAIFGFTTAETIGKNLDLIVPERFR